MNGRFMHDSRENREVARAAGIVGSLTLGSRILGYLRDMAIASIFGAGLASDAFIAAFRIPNLMRRLFGEGSLGIAFIPVFTDYLTNQGRVEAFRLAEAAIRGVSLILAAVAVLGVVSAPWILASIAPGFGIHPEKLDLAVLLTRIMFPYIFFIGLVALCMGILNALGHFAAPALAPVMLNLAMIGAVLAVSSWSGDQKIRVIGLAVGVLIGGILQLALQLPLLLRKGIHFFRGRTIMHPGLKRVAGLILPTVLGAAVYQINILIGTLLASFLPQGSVSYLYYADRLVQFPLGVFAIAMGTAVLPSLSRQASRGDMNALADTFGHSLRLVFFITMPAMVGLIILREPIIVLLFKRGAFDHETTRLTAVALLYYGIGLWSFAGVRILVATFYALKDTRTPVIMATLSITANVILGIFLMGPMAHGGLALATSLSSVLNLVLLVLALRRRIISTGWGRIGQSIGKSMVCALIMGGIVWILGRALFFGSLYQIGAIRLGLCLGGIIVIGVLTFAVVARSLKMAEISMMMPLISKRE
jgi:putative peptidoglycan lipid II flippase